MKKVNLVYGVDLYVRENESRSEVDSRRRIFLLTKPPEDERSKLCLRLMEHTKDAALYLAADGVFNLLGDSLAALPPSRIYACREDVQARGVKSTGGAIVLDDFYDRLVVDMMNDGNKVYSF